MIIRSVRDCFGTTGIAPVRAVSLLALFYAAILFATTSCASIVFAPPESSPDAATELKGIERELADQNFSAAAKRFDGLLAARTEQLAILNDSTLAAPAWLAQLPAPQRAALASEYSKAFSVPARQLLDSTKKSHVPRPDELYAVARRYPMTPAAGVALAEAGDHAQQLGDFPAAQAYYQLAMQENFTLGEARTRRMSTLMKINAGVITPAPSDLENVSYQGAKPQAEDRLPFTGPLPFDAPWFGNPMLLGHSKLFPAVCDDRILLASWKGVAMLRENGQQLWTSPNTGAPGAFSTERAPMLGRGALFAPAILSDIHGRPVTIVVHYPTGRGESQFALRALRAADGKTLWTTPLSPSNDALTYGGLPVVSGRYVYSLAATKTGPASGNLLLCAFDITTGESLWQTNLGTVAEQGDIRFGGKFGRNQPISLDSFIDLSEPAISGDLVFVSPNCGSLIAVGRFDGKIRWIHEYRQSDTTAPRKPGRWMPADQAEKALLTRYRCTPVVCGNVVLTMPQDAAAVFAVDSASGKPRWETDIIEGFALVGASGNLAIISGETISAVDAVTAKLKWKYVPPHNVTITGPAVVLAQTIIAPITGGYVQLSAADGSEKPTYIIPNFRHLLTTESGKAAISETGAAKAFGPPPAH